MLLAIDVGNTNITCAVISGEETKANFRLTTKQSRTSDEFGIIICDLLEKRGVKQTDITDVIITHSHHDHIECVKYFENAVIHIQKDEYEIGKKYIPDILNINIFENDFEVSKNIKVIKIGGHSKGSCVVEIEKSGEIYVIAGDECYLRECLILKIPTGSSCNQKASRDFVEKYSDERYKVLLCHGE
jgi:glyoxylase-like metal-dependent hydrolase (beta-lactamase superfamily II)